MHCHYIYSTHATQHTIYLRLFRIKLEPGSSSIPEFYHGHPEMPFNSRPTSGYHIGDLIRILLQSDMADHKVCTRCKKECCFHCGRGNDQLSRSEGRWPWPWLMAFNWNQKNHTSILQHAISPLCPYLSLLYPSAVWQISPSDCWYKG